MEQVQQRMLTRNLRNLESAGLVSRRSTGSKVVNVEYSLTKEGRTIIGPLRGMCRWAKQYRKVERRRATFVNQVTNTKKEKL